VLFDLMLPHIKGIPIIVMRAKVDADNKVDLLPGGAVDYVTKPFHTKELLARIAVHLRTFDALGKTEFLAFEEIQLDTDKHKVTVDDMEIKWGLP